MNQSSSSMVLFAPRTNTEACSKHPTGKTKEGSRAFFNQTKHLIASQVVALFTQVSTSQPVAFTRERNHPTRSQRRERCSPLDDELKNHEPNTSTCSALRYLLPSPWLTAATTTTGAGALRRPTGEEYIPR